MSAKYTSANLISNNGTAKVSPGTGLYLYIVAVTSVESAAQNITFSTDAALGVLEIPAASTLSLPFPIRCSSFTPSHADISVVYFVGGAFN